MKKKLPSIVVLLVAVCIIVWDPFDRPSERTGLTDPNNRVLASAFESRQSGVPVAGNGIVIKVLPDDNDGNRHQRFILRLSSGQTLVIAHNIDLAPRLRALKEGDAVAFNGQYEWNPQGGAVHWTHRDPKGRHPDGWLKHRGQTYQ